MKKTFGYIDTNEPMFNFSTSNIGYTSLSNVWVLRMEGFVLRVRLVIYTILIVTLTAFPMACTLSIWTLEILHISVYTFYAFKYRYAKNWFLMISKINVGLAILAITGTGTLINLSFDDAESHKNKVDPILQHICIIIFLFSVSLEMVVVILDLVIRVV